MIISILSNQHWLAKAGSFISSLAMKLGGPGILLIAIFDSSFLSFPEANDFLIVILSAGRSWGQMAYYVSMTIIGSVIGCLLLYMAGRKGGSPLLRRKFSEKSVNHAEKLYEKYGILTVVIPCILPPPTPFKVFVLSAGVFRLPIAEFLMAVMIGRTIRYSLWGILAVLYGNAVKIYIQQNLESTGMVLFVLFMFALAGMIIYVYSRQMRKANIERT
jgi:membrane protein YqaA with SNARE-associated domain